MTEKIGFIAGFLVLTMIVNAVAGDKNTERFLYVILASMVLLNSGKIVSWLKTKFN